MPNVKEEGNFVQLEIWLLTGFEAVETICGDQPPKLWQATNPHLTNHPGHADSEDQGYSRLRFAASKLKRSGGHTAAFHNSTIVFHWPRSNEAAASHVVCGKDASMLPYHLRHSSYVVVPRCTSSAETRIARLL